jgi:tRNA-specific 2-thiouridylase
MELIGEYATNPFERMPFDIPMTSICRTIEIDLREMLGETELPPVIEPYKDVVLNPKHGYGANLNPCLDCKTFMVANAFDWMKQHSFDFIITGEVMGQRPMSQRKATMPVVQRESGAGDLLLRPLCAKKLPPTLPEREGWVDRDQLYEIHGRGRKPQFALAEQFGITDFAQPAGGCCFLTDRAYANKLSDLWINRGKRDYELDDIMLLKVGRHLRPRENFKIIISREEGESNFLMGYRKQFTNMQTVSHGGPLALLDGTMDEEDLMLAARLVARFSQGRNAKQVTIDICDKLGNARQLDVMPLSPNDIPVTWYL